MGRDVEYPLTPELELNLADLLIALNMLREQYGRPMRVSSGYRPGVYNKLANGAPNSPHKTLQACDFYDADRHLTNWILQNPIMLVECKLYMENPMEAPSWCHLQTRAVPSGRRIFTP